MSDPTKKITAKQLVEMLANGEQLPTCGTIDEDYPSTASAVYNLIADYWNDIDAMRETQWAIRHLAESEESE